MGVLFAAVLAAVVEREVERGGRELRSTCVSYEPPIAKPEASTRGQRRACSPGLTFLMGLQIQTWTTFLSDAEGSGTLRQ